MNRAMNPDFMVEEGHLGGYIHGGDPATYMPHLWKYLATTYNVKSMIDVGCGRGYTVESFAGYGVDAWGIDGSTQAITTSVAPDRVLQHDFTKGPFVPDRVLDLGWSCEFVEHVEPHYMANFLTTFAKCRHLAMTFAGPGQEGYHHVNCQPASYWIAKLTEYGLIYSESETQKLRLVTYEDAKAFNAQYMDNHFMTRGMFFNNPSL